jgi:hypothetical protein
MPFPDDRFPVFRSPLMNDRDPGLLMAAQNYHGQNAVVNASPNAALLFSGLSKTGHIHVALTKTDGGLTPHADGVILMPSRWATDHGLEFPRVADPHARRREVQSALKAREPKEEACF